MPDMNQPNLQAILSDYGSNRANAYKKLEQAAYSDEAEKLKREAIDAIYAGLLAVIGEDDEVLHPNHAALMGIRNRLKNDQRQALKRWCYGETK